MVVVGDDDVHRIIMRGLSWDEIIERYKELGERVLTGTDDALGAKLVEDFDNWRDAMITKLLQEHGYRTSLAFINTGERDIQGNQIYRWYTVLPVDSKIEEG